MSNSLKSRKSELPPYSKRIGAIVVFGLCLFLQLIAPSNFMNNQEMTQVPSNGSSGAISCSITFEKSKGVEFLSGDVEGWPFELSLPNEWIISGSGTRILRNQNSNLLLESPTSPTFKLTFGKTLNGVINGSCKKGEIQSNSFPDGVTNITVKPETLLNLKPRMFQQLFSENIVDDVKIIFFRILLGLKFSAILLGFLYIFWLIGYLLVPRFAHESRLLLGALSLFLSIGGLNYFYKLEDVNKVLFALLLMQSVIAKKRNTLSFRQLRDVSWINSKLVAFVVFIGQIASSTDFRSIGLLQTDTYNYRAQIELFREIRLLDLRSPAEGFGARSIDYSNRSWVQLISQTDAASAILLWGAIWLALVFLAGHLIADAKYPNYSRYIWILALPGLLGMWVEGYLSRYSVAAASMIAILIMHAFKSREKEYTYHLMLLAAYSFAIVPAFLPLILLLPFWYFTKRRFVYGLKIGLITACIAAPSSLWMRNIQTAFGFANDGVLDGIAKNIVIPHWDQLAFPAQILGYVSWHAGGFRSPISKQQSDYLGFLDQMVISLAPYLIVLSFFVLAVMIYQSKFLKNWDLPQLFVILFVSQLALFILTDASFYVTIMFVLTLGPVMSIALYTEKPRSPKIYIKMLSIAVVASLGTTIVQGSLWYRNSSSQVAVNSYWSNGVAANEVIKILDGQKFTASQGEFTSDYAFFIRLSEIGLTSDKGQCVNCLVSSRGIDLLPESKDSSYAPKRVVIFGNCPQGFSIIRAIGAYTLCSRFQPKR
jgi:hypothetical protein